MDLMDNIFNSCVKYDIQGSYSCDKSGCRDDGVCRCFRIDSVNINEIDINYLTNIIHKMIFETPNLVTKRNNKINQILRYDKDIDKMILNRLLVIDKIYDPTNWESTWVSGYYGDEICDISMCKKIYNNLIQDIEDIYNLNTVMERIKYLLKKENGYLVESVIDKLNYDIRIVFSKDILFGQIEHLENIKNKNCEYYTDDEYEGIRGICIKQGDKWRIIDGYHRIYTTKSDKIKIITLC